MQLAAFFGIIFIEHRKKCWPSLGSKSYLIDGLLPITLSIISSQRRIFGLVNIVRRYCLILNCQNHFFLNYNYYYNPGVVNSKPISAKILSDVCQN